MSLMGKGKDKPREIRGTHKENIFKDSIRRELLIRLNWSTNWDWYVDLIRERKRAVDCYRKSGPRAITSPQVEERDARSVLPFPVTTNQDYGWLSTKEQFELEIFGAYYSTTKLSNNVVDTSSSSSYSNSDSLQNY